MFHKTMSYSYQTEMFLCESVNCLFAVKNKAVFAVKNKTLCVVVFTWDLKSLMVRALRTTPLLSFFARKTKQKNAVAFLTF